ncbi:MAG: AlbA family DNA-binding domain-containing protein, partial [Gaiellaceae bacterium]
MLSQQELGRVMGRVGRRQSASFYESQVLEFKETGRSVKDTLSLLADAAVCLANAEGGTIVLGVNDKATTRAQALVGVEPSYSLDGIRRGIFDGSVPSLTCNAYEWQEDRVRLVVIDVPPGVLPCATSSGKATRRLGKECRPFTPDQQREMLAARGQV